MNKKILIVLVLLFASALTGCIEGPGAVMITEDELKEMTTSEKYEKADEIEELRFAVPYGFCYVVINGERYAIFEGNSVTIINISDDEEERVLEANRYSKAYSIHDPNIIIGEDYYNGYVEVWSSGYVFLHNSTIERLNVFNDEHCVQ